MLFSVFWLHSLQIAARCHCKVNFQQRGLCYCRGLSHHRCHPHHPPFLPFVILPYYASSSSSSFFCYHNLPLPHSLLLSVPYSSLIPISLSLPSSNLILPSSFFLRLHLHISSPSEIQRMPKAHCVFSCVRLSC